MSLREYVRLIKDSGQLERCDLERDVTWADRIFLVFTLLMVGLAVVGWWRG